MWTPNRADRLQRLRRRAPWKFSHFRKTNGYVVGAARRPVAAGAVSAQRIGAVAGRSARAGGRAPEASSGAATTSSTGTRVGFVIDGPRSRTRRHAFRRRAARQQQRRPHLRHDAGRRREARAARVSEIALDLRAAEAGRYAATLQSIPFDDGVCFYHSARTAVQSIVDWLGRRDSRNRSMSLFRRATAPHHSTE